MDSRLVSESDLIHAIYVQNKNQHRGQHWWKYFSILHRRLRQIVTQKTVDVQTASYLGKKLIPRAYRAFQTVLAQGAFITLGFTLIATLARVWTLLKPHIPQSKSIDIKPPTILGMEDDIGVSIEEEASIEPPQPAAKPRKVKKEKKDASKKKKKKKDAIDDIFGF